MPYYAVRVGRSTGVFSDWYSYFTRIIVHRSECEAMVKGFSGAQYKKFSTYTDAFQFVDMKASNCAPKQNKADISIHDSNMSDLPVVYTDGACVGPSSLRQAGYGVYWGPSDPRLVHPNILLTISSNVSERLSGEQTNNRAEIEAAITAARQAKQAGIPRIVIATDSKFTQQCATEWGPVWEKNGWRLFDGKPVKLREAVERLLKATRDSGVEVSWHYVPGHSGVEGNEEADRLANEGAKKPLPVHVSCSN
ncbi:hypothetical protein AHF37_07988 [Paragonimus kellicotti]|nr:hypothetical protein AHF37_07988 [Paragonimus kellicotti]